MNKITQEPIATSATANKLPSSPYVAKRIAELAAATSELDSLSPNQVDTVMRAVVFGDSKRENHAL